MNTRSIVRRSLVAAVISVTATSAHAGVIDTPLPNLTLTGAPGKTFAIATGLRTTAEVAVVVSCTNLDSGNVGVSLEFFAFSGLVSGSGETTIPAGYTRTIATQDTVLYAEDLLAPATLNQGSLRISASSTKLMCNVVMVEDASAAPSMVDVPLIIKKQKGD